MDQIKFKSLEELYNRLYPALSIRSKEFASMGVYFSETDIWNYLRVMVWPNNKNLTLYDMVSDIFKSDINKIKMYLDK